MRGRDGTACQMMQVMRIGTAPLKKMEPLQTRCGFVRTRMRLGEPGHEEIRATESQTTNA